MVFIYAFPLLRLALLLLLGSPITSTHCRPPNNPPRSALESIRVQAARTPPGSAPIPRDHPPWHKPSNPSHIAIAQFNQLMSLSDADFSHRMTHNPPSLDVLHAGLEQIRRGAKLGTISSQKDREAGNHQKREEGEADEMEQGAQIAVESEWGDWDPNTKCPQFQCLCPRPVVNYI